MEVTLLGMVICARLLQLRNAQSSMLVTLLGMETEVSFRQLPKAYFPMLVMPSEIVAERISV